MKNLNPYRRLLQGSYHRAVACWSAALLGVMMLLQPALAQTFTPLHQFTGHDDGANPGAGLTIDHAGNLYGSTYHAGQHSLGTAFQITARGTFNVLYAFQGGMDGSGPFSRLVMAPNGILYGTTWLGGGNDCNGSGCGTVYSLRPFPSVCHAALCPWMENVLYRFSGPDGATPEYGDLVFDNAGNLYGTTVAGGANGDGAAYELSPHNGVWSESRLYSFSAAQCCPWSGVTFDSSGNLYGTLFNSGTHNAGAIYQLMPAQGGWNEDVIYNFTGMSDGGDVYAGLIKDAAGNFYGATTLGLVNGNYFGGTVFEISPDGDSWNLQTLYTFPPSENIPTGPFGNLAFGPDGCLYGLTYRGGTDDFGIVFKLCQVDDEWVETTLHQFTGFGDDGGGPQGAIVFDAAGNLYGTSSTGGHDGHGVVWKITQ